MLLPLDSGYRFRLAAVDNSKEQARGLALHERVPHPVGLAAELQQAPVVRDAACHRGGYLVVPEDGTRLESTRPAVITTDCLL